jgi:hypothetical protein
VQRKSNRIGTYSKSVGNLLVGHHLEASHREYLGLSPWKQRNRAAQSAGQFTGGCILVWLRRSIGHLGCFDCWLVKWPSPAPPKPVNRPSRGQTSKETGPVPYFGLLRSPICLQKHVLYNILCVVIVSHDSANGAHDQFGMAIHDLWPVIRHYLFAFLWDVMGCHKVCRKWPWPYFHNSTEKTKFRWGGTSLIGKLIPHVSAWVAPSTSPGSALKIQNSELQHSNSYLV